MSSPGELRRDNLLWLLGRLCGVFRIPFDAALIAQGYPPPCTLATLHDAARAMEIRTGDCTLAHIDRQKLLLPVIAYSWQLSLIALDLLGLIAIVSLLVAPVFRDKLNRQFLLGARNPSFLTEYVCGMATVTSLQMEPDIDRKYGDLLAQYLTPGFSAKQIGNTYNVTARTSAPWPPTNCTAASRVARNSASRLPARCSNDRRS